MEDLRDIILEENSFIWNGGQGSGWYAPPKGTHVKLTKEVIRNSLNVMEKYSNNRSDYIHKRFPAKPIAMSVNGYYDYKQKEIFRSVPVEDIEDYAKSDKHFIGTHFQTGTGVCFFGKKSDAVGFDSRQAVIEAKVDMNRIIPVEKLQTLRSRVVREADKNNWSCPADFDMGLFAASLGLAGYHNKGNDVVVILDRSATVVPNWDNFNARGNNKGVKMEKEETTAGRREEFVHGNEDRMARLNSIIERFNGRNGFNPLQPRDKYGKWCSMGYWNSFSQKTGLGNPYEVGENGLTKRSLVGVAGGEIPDKLPRIKGLSKEQNKIQEEFAKNWEDENLRKANLKKLADMKPFNEGRIETDAIKQLDPNWGTEKRFETLAERELDGTATLAEINELAKYRKYRQENNTVLHQAANALAKEYIRQQVAKDPNVTVVVTSGGCGSGKGFGLEPFGKELIKQGSDPKLYSKFEEATKGKKLIWDAAGDQNGTELAWVSGLGQKKTVIVHTVGDPKFNANNAVYAKKGEAKSQSSGLVSRAMKNGRMVDGTVYAQSYEIGNANAQAFYLSQRGNENIAFFKVVNPGKGYPKEAKETTRLVEFTTKHKFEDIKLSSSQATKLIKDGLKEMPDVPQSVKDSILKGGAFVNDMLAKF